ncbi:transcriptional regulator [Propionigenium maris DSM 9537]|uniref:Transcriptional regulator n=1 Tax=Propionigenium maris DSM 9537 TaxID=1123000 RepID=A0A9W6GN65_9FUSO|nr:MarR family transcriptional regulator [Propionigenium maris]GLI56894.1 transcriptional regulator [Propionigenium maris DSM 9537]
MRTDVVIGVISNIREKSAQFINKELKDRGVEGLINSHGTVLSAMYDNDGKMTMNGIARFVGKRKSTITDMVKKLEKLGYVSREKSKEDARVIEVTLTEKGWEFRDIFKEISRELLDKTYTGFTEDEKEVLMGLLFKIRKNFREE